MSEGESGVGSPNKEKQSILTSRLTEVYGVNTAKAVNKWLERAREKAQNDGKNLEDGDGNTYLDEILANTGSSSEKAPAIYLRDEIIKEKYIPEMLREHTDLVLTISAKGGNTFGENMDPRLKEWGEEFKTVIEAVSEITKALVEKNSKPAKAEAVEPVQEPAQVGNMSAIPERSIDEALSIAKATTGFQQDSPERKYIVTRDGYLVETPESQLTDEERTILGLEAQKTVVQDLKQGEITLETLIASNPNYDYKGITPEMIDRAVEWAKNNGFSPLELGPAQISLAQEWEPQPNPQ